MKILLWPSPTLKKVSDPVDIESIKNGSFIYEDRKLVDLLEDMDKLMWINSGLGLSAIQVGIPLRIVKTLIRDIRVMINPVIIQNMGQQERVQEGCLSLPKIYAAVKRYPLTMVRFFDETGKEHTKELNGTAAQCVQHELEHLDGQFFTEQLTKAEQQMVFGEINKVRKNGQWRTKLLE